MISPEGLAMPQIRIQLRTMMIGIAALVVLFGALRFVLWFHEVFGIEFLFYIAYNVAIFLFIPLVTIVEFIFFAFYFWRRRKPAGRSRRIAKMPAGPASRPWRRFLRVSVRGLIVLVLVTGAWLGWIVRSARIQRDAVAAIAETGGDVNYNWEWKDGVPVPAARPWAPRWLVDLLGVDYFGHVTRVSYARGVNDRRLARHAEFDARLSELRAKIKGALGCADPEIVTQEQRQKVRELTMGDGKTFAAKLEELEQLLYRDHDFRYYPDEELAHLKWLTNLSELDLASTSVSDAGLARLKGLANLRCLDFSFTPVNDAGLAHLNGLTNLSELRLDGTQVTDAGLVHLIRMTKLAELNLWRTKVTDAGAKKLQQSLPSLKITR